MFFIGALLAKHRHFLTKICSRLSYCHKTLILIGATICYTAKWTFFPRLNELDPYLDFIIVIGIIVLIVAALSSKIASQILLLKPIAFLGRISYSLYLFHFLIILGMVRLFDNILHLWLTLLMVLPISFLTATVAYYGLEQPSINLWKQLTSKSGIARITALILN
jgi:peptidoglycan/LPS O-acetylase OafA/YrhL